MSIALRLRSLRNALRVLPVDWVLWALDADGVLVAWEGPGASRAGRPAEVGGSMWRSFDAQPSVLGFASLVLREPATAELTAGGRRLYLAGAPVAGGGAAGLALPLGAAEAGGAAGAAPPAAVLELLCPVPEIGAETGDLLVWNPERPEAVGCYREVEASRLPDGTLRDLRLTRSSDGAVCRPPVPSRGGAVPPLRERAAHLRVVS